NMKPFEKAQKAPLTAEEVIQFYDETIPDLPLSNDYGKNLLALFSSIPDNDFLFFSNLGPEDEKKVTLEEAIEQKRKDLENIQNLITKITEDKKDNAVTLGQESIFYAHLKKILKHLYVHLENASIEEKLTYLKDL